MKYEVVKRRGSFLQEIEGAPLFENRTEAEEWARSYMEDNPDQFEMGLEAVEVRPIPSLST